MNTFTFFFRTCIQSSLTSLQKRRTNKFAFFSSWKKKSWDFSAGRELGLSIGPWNLDGCVSWLAEKSLLLLHFFYRVKQHRNLRQSTELSILTFILFFFIPIAMLHLGGILDSTKSSELRILYGRHGIILWLEWCVVVSCQCFRIFIYIRHPETERSVLIKRKLHTFVQLKIAEDLLRSRSTRVSKTNRDVDIGSSGYWDSAANWFLTGLCLEFYVFCSPSTSSHRSCDAKICWEPRTTHV